MKPDKVLALKNGIYRIYWNDGGTSLASVGRTHTGSVWMAPSSWSWIDIARSNWSLVKHVEPIAEE
jgi:hypothetical protein